MVFSFDMGRKYQFHNHSKDMLFVSTIISVLLLTCFPFAQALVSKPATMLTAANPAKQGCQSKCGNLTIPYPFGIGKDCAMGDDYIVMCITKNGTKYAAYWNEYSVILNITETELTMESLPVAQSCDGETLKEKVTTTSIAVFM